MSPLSLPSRSGNKWPAPFAGLLLALVAGFWGLPVFGARAETMAVSGVAADDVLYLRAEPRAGAALVGAFPPTLSGIAVERTENGWALVHYKDRSGWAALRYLKPVAFDPPALPPLPLRCVGTEPFWALDVEKARIVFDRMEHEKESGAARITPLGAGRTAWKLVPEGGSILSAEIEDTGATCSDGMSDRAFPLHIQMPVRDRDRPLKGCCAPSR